MTAVPGLFLAFGQTKAATQQVSDSIAYRFILLSLSLPDNPSDRDLVKQDLRFRRLSLGDNDEQVLKALLASFHREYATWLAGVAPITAHGAPDVASQRDAIVERYRTLMEQSLSQSGSSAVRQYVLSEKSKMHN
jgi:hypothetical protein